MIVSTNWLGQYVSIDIDVAALADRFSMAGLNHEETTPVGDEYALDLEVTSNRPDWLGHIGVAREVSVLYSQELKIPAVDLDGSGGPVTDAVKVSVSCPDICYRYTARVIRGVKIGPSPDWLAERLRAIGQPVVNNVVDITNFVMMECGQPLHAFDLSKVAGPEIIVRRATKGEQFTAIDHRTYELDPDDCVIGDATSAAALGGVMGGAESEVTEQTVDLLIESAEFAPLSVRTTARRLRLHSASSYRFERRVDPVGVDWASRRCCQLILEIAGGQLCEGVIDTGPAIEPRETINLRLAQIQRVLGIAVPRDEVERIVVALGCQVVSQGDDFLELRPATWRRDLTREIDLIEEVARIYGYEMIPEDAKVPMVSSHRTDQDRVVADVRRVLTAVGIDEAMTRTVTPEAWSQVFTPWTTIAPLAVSSPMIQGEEHLRQSVIPSLLNARRLNESKSNPNAELFEVAKLFLPQRGALPDERWVVAFVCGRGYLDAKGIAEHIGRSMNPRLRLGAEPIEQALLEVERSCYLTLAGSQIGVVGELSDEGRKQFKLRGDAAVCELQLAPLIAAAELIRQHRIQSEYPAIDRDINVIVDESLTWAELDATIRDSCGPDMEQITYLDTYRDPGKDGTGKKRLLFNVTFRSQTETLTGSATDSHRDRIVEAIAANHDGQLVG
ncbi:MAG: phenylalanine--tRNA ligase subunit beta [Pirellulaceae bacterium]|jgi:phenylalanyl-tRNA synthetase beta chain|nr:phenylalanine--tRNA ligase subunit beta [Pirellulaceae bacterium]